MPDKTHRLAKELRFNTAINPDLMKMQGERPRIAFSGVTARAFTLKANINQLQRFCDNYLNFVDERHDCSGQYFKAALPFVYLQMINYGKMSTESENLGWIAQHEVLFSVPVQWFVENPETGKLEFHDWALVCPYVYVDNDQSLQTGREVFGWAKVRSWLQPAATTWTTDPRLPRQLLNLRTELFPKLYAGEKQEPRTLIEILQDAPPSLFRNPVSRNDVFNPLWAMPQAMRQSFSLLVETFEMTSGLPIFGYQRSRNVQATGQILRKTLGSLSALMPWMSARADSIEVARDRSRVNKHSPYINNLTFKQFRDAEEPQLACYQALVNSRISVENYRDGGLLGGPSVLMGDLTGGYRIKIHNYPEHPIISTLGLEATSSESGELGESTSVLTPILPFWVACDLRYDLGETLCWRTKRTKWSKPDKTQTGVAKKPDEAQNVAVKAQKGDAENPGAAQNVADEKPRRNRYNTTLGATIQESIGPFHYPDATLRVFPLMADSMQLEKFVCDHLYSNINDMADATDARHGYDATANLESLPQDDPQGETIDASTDIKKNSFRAWGSYVYMVVTSYDSAQGRPYSEENNLGSISGREISFWVPVRRYVNGKLAGVGFITPYVFCSNMRHVITEREVAGRAAMHSTIESNDDYWLRESGPVADHRRLAKTRTLLMPALNAGQPARMCDLIEIYEGDVAGYNEDIPWAVIKSGWKPKLDADLEAKANEKRCWKRDPGASLPEGWTEEDWPNEDWDALKNHFASTIRESRPLNFFNLKQYRATEDASGFCFQSLVQVRKTIETLWDVREIPKRIHIGINEYPTMPIIKQLGLQVKTTSSCKDGVVAHLQPIRPFFLRVSIKEDLGQNLYSRVPGEDWQLEDNARTIKDLGGATDWIQAVQQPQAIVESLLWDGFGGHDTTSAWGDIDEDLGEKTPKDRPYPEFFIPKFTFPRPGHINQQVLSSNTPDEE